LLAPDRRSDCKCCKRFTFPCPTSRRPARTAGTDQNVCRCQPTYRHFRWPYVTFKVNKPLETFSNAVFRADVQQLSTAMMCDVCHRFTCCLKTRLKVARTSVDRQCVVCMPVNWRLRAFVDNA